MKNAVSTDVLATALVSKYGIFYSSHHYLASSLVTCLSSSLSILLPITINGKLFGSDGVLEKYGLANKGYAGCKLKITKNFNAKYAGMKTDEVAAILKMSIEEAEKYRKEISDAMKNKTLYTVETV